ncbi:MAG: urease accessory protein UreD [Litorilinea sp.]|nr:MAG: urease accessory protein UreD [Litorilinea sp.]
MASTTPRTCGALALRFSRPEPQGPTRLHVQRQEPPLRVIRAFPIGEQGALVHLHNVSGGVLGGDQLTVEVTVEPGAYAQLTTTGATRLYRPRPHSPPACQHTDLRVGAGGILEYLPDPIIPFTAARYRQQTHVLLEADAGFFGWEVVAPGREASGERFAYTWLELALTIEAVEPADEQTEASRVKGRRPIALERARLEPAPRPPASPIRLGPYLHYANFYACRVGVPHERWLALEETLADLADSLSQEGRCLWGASTLAAHGVAVRGVASQGRDLLQGLPRFWQEARHFLYGSTGEMPRKLY